MGYKTNEMNIEKELFDAWKKHQRKTDVEELMVLTGKGRSLIVQALRYGHVKDEKVVDIISKFYIDRANKQKEQARLILGEEPEGNE